MRRAEAIKQVDAAMAREIMESRLPSGVATSPSLVEILSGVQQLQRQQSPDP